MKRHRISRKVNKRNFRYAAKKVHKRNLHKSIKRGGYRL